VGGLRASGEFPEAHAACLLEETNYTVGVSTCLHCLVRISIVAAVVFCAATGSAFAAFGSPDVQPVNQSPASGAVLRPSAKLGEPTATVTLSGQVDPYAVGEQIDLDDAADFASPLGTEATSCEGGGEAGPSVPRICSANLLTFAPGTYYWRISAQNFDTGVVYGAPTSFTVAAAQNPIPSIAYSTSFVRTDVFPNLPEGTTGARIRTLTCKKQGSYRALCSIAHSGDVATL